jgi:hypothetical protein
MKQPFCILQIWEWILTVTITEKDILTKTSRLHVAWLSCSTRMLQTSITLVLLIVRIIKHEKLLSSMIWFHVVWLKFTYILVKPATSIFPTLQKHWESCTRLCDVSHITANSALHRSYRKNFNYHTGNKWFRWLASHYAHACVMKTGPPTNTHTHTKQHADLMNLLFLPYE